MVNQHFSFGKAKDNLFLDDGLWTRRRQIRSPFEYPWVERERQFLVFRLHSRGHPQNCASVLTPSGYEIWAG